VFGEPNDAGFELGIDESTDEHFIFGALIWHAVVIYTMLNMQARSMFDCPLWLQVMITIPFDGPKLTCAPRK